MTSLRDPRLIRRVLGLLTLAAFLYGITAIPYVLAASRAPARAVFDGFLVFDEDQDMYFSFIRQGADGHVLFINRLTSAEHKPVFLNLEWLAVGWAQALVGSPDVAYQLWRAAGALGVVCGFWALAQVTLQNPVQRRIAMAMALFGGGFQWLFFLRNEVFQLAGLSGDPWPLEFPFFATHPFGQVLANPHFAFPLGLVLFLFAAYVKGEQTKNWRWYVAAGILAALDGLARPYDMIALYVAIPIFVVVESVRGKLDWRTAWLRTLPLVVVAPVFLYTIYLFDMHPVFRYWASQGSGTRFGIVDTLAHVGLAGPLVAVRLALRRRFPLRSSAERLLLCWLGCVFFLVHSREIPLFRFMPYTPQLMTILMPPAILLGIVALGPAETREPKGAQPAATDGRNRVASRWRGATVVVTAFLAFNAIDSVTLLGRLTPDGRDLTHYIPQTEMEAFQWLDQHASENDVVLSGQQTGHRLAKNASVRVALGHWSVTPLSRTIAENALYFYAARMTSAETAEFLEQLHVTWIYFGLNERALGLPDLDHLPGFTKHVLNGGVTVYRRSDVPERTSP